MAWSTLFGGAVVPEFFRKSVRSLCASYHLGEPSNRKGADQLIGETRNYRELEQRLSRGRIS